MANPNFSFAKEKSKKNSSYSISDMFSNETDSLDTENSSSIDASDPIESDSSSYSEPQELDLSGSLDNFMETEKSNGKSYGESLELDLDSINSINLNPENEVNTELTSIEAEESFPVQNETHVQNNFIDIDTLINDSLNTGLISKSGSFYEVTGFPGTKQRGYNAFKNSLLGNNEALNYLNSKLNGEGGTEEAKEDDLTFDESDLEVPGTEANDASYMDQEAFAGKILKYVCKKTISHLLETYKSEMYTEKYTSNLFTKYLDDGVDSSNPLFEELISEAISNLESGDSSNENIDPYLGDLTVEILKYINQK